MSALLFACTDDGTHTKLDLSNYTVDKVVCQASSSTLIADNTAELDLQVAIYSKAGTYTDKFGTERDRYIEVPRERWRDHDVKFYVNGQQVTPPYKTGNATPAVLQCYAEVDGVRSSQSPAETAALYQRLGATVAAGETAPEEPDTQNPFFFDVTVETPYDMPARRIPVVFHIIDTRHNGDRGQTLDAAVIYGVIDRWNDVFGRKIDSAPNGGNANLEFVPAIWHPDGTKLVEPGINRVYLESTDINDITATSSGSNNIGGFDLWLSGGVRVYSSTRPYNQTNPYTLLTANIFTHLVDNNMLSGASFYDYSARRINTRIFRNDRYLNVWVVCDDYVAAGMMNFQYVAANCLPTVFSEDNGATPYDADALPLPPSVTIRKLSAADLNLWRDNPGNIKITQPSGNANDLNRRVKSPRSGGLVFSKSRLANYAAQTYDIDLAAHVGAFFGLVPNSLKTVAGSTYTWYDDYCSDTPVYDLWYYGARNGGIEAAGSGSTYVKYTTTAPYHIYRSTNIMDTYSLGTTITPQQLKRMDWVLNNAPGRMMWKDLTAIAE